MVRYCTVRYGTVQYGAADPKSRSRRPPSITAYSVSPAYGPLRRRRLPGSQLGQLGVSLLHGGGHLPSGGLLQGQHRVERRRQRHLAVDVGTQLLGAGRVGARVSQHLLPGTVRVVPG